MGATRPPAVAGSFYPANAKALRAVVQEHLAEARASFAPSGAWPKALIVPHAGYMYSGPVAAHAYVSLEAGFDVIDRVALLGPSHHVPFSGVAAPSNTAFETPLGCVSIDEDNRRRVLELPFVHTLDDAHHWEHSLEVQLPFLQEVLDRFVVLPLAVGRATPAEVAAALDLIWGGDETLIVISSDLSHYRGYAEAKRRDASTSAAIERMDASAIDLEDACGAFGVGGLLEAAKARGLVARTLDLRSSGDTAGARDEVVGYGAWAFTASRNGSP